MIRRIEEFEIAWNALSGNSANQGWRTIPLSPVGACSLMAGRQFPDNEETLLAGFASAVLPSAEKLPEGIGFSVSRVDPYKDGKVWVALTRKPQGSVSIFTQIVSDVVSSMDSMNSQSDEKILRALLSRLRAWQEFMRKGQQPLSPEEEIGLIGELSLLRAMINEGLSVDVAVQSWLGPLGGLQDFEIGTGALEVKSTISSAGFLAKISSLDQLDDSVRQPLFIAGVRFSQRLSGNPLPKIVQDLRQLMATDKNTLRIFGDRLLSAGYQDDHANGYVRSLILETTRVLEVNDGFPRLVSGSVPQGIRRAVYEIDLDHITGTEISLIDALKKLGVL